MSRVQHGGNVLLLRTACITLIIGLILAWCLTFTKLVKIPFMVDLFQHPEKLLSAHLDFLMMTMLLFGFYASKITLPKYVQWSMAIGSITNPGLFILAAIVGNDLSAFIMLLVVVSFSLTTFGYGLGAIKLLRYSLK